MALEQNYGDRLCLEDDSCLQSTLPFGTPDGIRREVRDRKRVLGIGGRYTLGPSHWIQAGTPPEIIVAMYDEAAGATR